jgi:ribonuclease HII
MGCCDVDTGLYTPERWAWRLGFERIAGTDEAGRGALAGPLVAAAVILGDIVEPDTLEEVTDSKLLTPERRKELFKRITMSTEAWAFSCISPADIDRRGLQSRNILALREAVLSLNPAPDLVIVDYYRIGDLDIPQWGLVHGDLVCRSVAAASILAKVIRDHLMWFWSLRYPEYGFERNKGYGTKHHIKALADHGPSPCHRNSFRGVMQMELDLEERVGK